MWSTFRATFLELWSDEDLHKGQDYLRPIYPDSEALDKAQAHYMERLWQVIKTRPLPFSVRLPSQRSGLRTHLLQLLRRKNLERSRGLALLALVHRPHFCAALPRTPKHHETSKALGAHSSGSLIDVCVPLPPLAACGSNVQVHGFSIASPERRSNGDAREQGSHRPVLPAPAFFRLLPLEKKRVKPRRTRWDSRA